LLKLRCEPPVQSAAQRGHPSSRPPTPPPILHPASHRTHQGGCWWLTSNPVTIEAATHASGAGVFANAFTREGGCTDPATASGTGPVGEVLAYAMDASGASAPLATVTLSFADPFGGVQPACASLTPGATFAQWQPVVPPPALQPSTGRWLLPPLALVRSAVLVRCRPQAQDNSV
jgi:hypothetical protein